MNFSTPSLVATAIYEMWRVEKARGENRALIDDLANGAPPYTDQEAASNNINVNVNFLPLTKIVHDARGQFNNAHLKPGYFFTTTTDDGPVEKRREWATIVTKNINRPLKRSLHYIETKRSKFAQACLHGIGPVNWPDRFTPYPDSIPIGDLLVPTNTRVSLEDLNHFAIHREWTTAKFFEMTHGPQVDRGWNMKLVNETLAKVQKENQSTIPLNWDQDPEKLVELWKENDGFFATDIVPKIAVWDFYFRGEKKESEVWNRRIVLDEFASHVPGANDQTTFLFDPGKRAYASALSELIHVQFADGANVAPFMYHSVRSLGFLLYAVCHLQNRLGCKFSESTFQQMMWFFRTSLSDDRERLQKVDLQHMGIIPEGLSFVPANERFKVDPGLFEGAMEFFRGIMRDNSASFLNDTMEGSEKDPTATYTMAKVNASSALISAMLNLSYTYETFEYREVFRRFCLKESKHADVIKFRKSCIREGVPEDMLDPDKWDIEPERVIGSGHKMLEITQVDRLMAALDRFDPDAQRTILHIYAEANTDDPKLAEQLVPIKPKQVSDTVHDAELAAGTLMQGLPVTLKQGINHGEYIITLIKAAALVIDFIDQANGSMATPQQLIGLQNLVMHAQEHLAILAKNEGAKQQVKQIGDAMARITNSIEGYAQRLEEQQQQAGQQGNISPEAQGKIISAKILAEAKAANMRESHAQRAQQKQQGWQMEEQRKQQQHQLEMQKQLEQTGVENIVQDLKTSAEILRQNKLAENQPPTEKAE